MTQSYQATPTNFAAIAPACPECGMLKNDWPGEGYSEEGQIFCCQGCAEGTGCTCVQAIEKEGKGFGQHRPEETPRPGRQPSGATAPAGELSGERDAFGTVEAIDERPLDDL